MRSHGCLTCRLRSPIYNVRKTSTARSNFLRQRIADAALKHRLPQIITVRKCGRAGLLMSSGPNLEDQSRRPPVSVEKILNGPFPADLPVEQPTKFELVINLKTARTLGVSI